MKLRAPTIRTAVMGFSVVAVLLLVVPAAMTLRGFSQVGAGIAEVRDSQKTLREISVIQTAAVEMQAHVGTVAHGMGGASTIERFRKAEQNARAGMTQLKNLVAGNTALEKQVREAEGILLKWMQDTSGLVSGVGKATGTSSVQAGGKTGASESRSCEPLADFSSLMQGLGESQFIRSDTSLRAAEEKIDSVHVPTSVGIPLYVVLFLLSSFLLAHYIVKPISDAAAFADAIRKGDLSRRISVAGLDEARRLGSSVNHMAQSFADYNKEILEGVKVLSDSVSQIATTASQLFTSASRTAAAVSETTATVNEMEGTAKVVNETSGRIAKHSEQSYGTAGAGIQATGDTLQKMNLIRDKMDIVAQAVVGLSENTKYVEDIVSAVQDLADQSNLLAVNASIEASHAGEQGKGFAVVAHEIKSLADQSRDATAKISKTLQEIRASVSSVVMATEEGGKAVQSGVEQSEAAGASIQQLSQSIAEFAQGAGVIYSTSSNQFGRVERVAGAMRSIELAMQDSVSGTTELENQAKRLEQVALSLQGLVGRFKFGPSA